MPAGEGTIEQALVEMDRVIERAVESGDARGWFAVVYRAVTARVLAGIEAGEFEDGERMARFDVRFARYWLDAHAGWDRGTRIADSWGVSFEAARRPGLILQHLLLGMNAHINLDLGVAAALTSPGTSIRELEGDFERINHVLAELVDQMQAAIAEVSPLMGMLDRVGRRHDEMLVSFSLERARRSSWAFAQTVAAADDPAPLLARRDRAVADIGRQIADPGIPLKWVVLAARLRERTDMPAVAAALRRRGADVPA